MLLRTLLNPFLDAVVKVEDRLNSLPQLVRVEGALSRGTLLLLLSLLEKNTDSLELLHNGVFNGTVGSKFAYRCDGGFYKVEEMLECDFADIHLLQNISALALQHSHVISLAEETVEDIQHAKGTRDNRRHHPPPPSQCPDATCLADKRKDIFFAEFMEAEFGEVAVGGKILEGVQGGAEVDEGFLLGLGGALAAEFDALAQLARDVVCRGVPAFARVGDVILHARLGVKLQLARIHRTPEPLIGILGIVGVSLGVVYMLHVGIAPQAFTRHVKLIGREAKLHKAQDTDDCPEHGLRHRVQPCSVDDLRKVAQPVPKVDLTPLERREAVMRHEADGEIPQGLSDVAVPPHVAIELAVTSHFSCAKG
ncbi:hypothetical protein HG530_012447 [Fusarium avenaceum]|nr:hypothetical protein HG530_012447 [Fusarium avenaceum]